MKQERVAIQDLPAILRERIALMDLAEFREYCLGKPANRGHAIRARCSRVQSRR